MFAPPNLLSNLCGEIATIRQGGTAHPGKKVDQYALRISSIFTRLLAESQRSAYSNKSPEIFALERLLPSIRVEQIWKDPTHTFASARDRARKHTSNDLHGVNAANLSSVVPTPTTPLKTQLETRLDDLQATIASLVEAPKHHKCGRSKTKRRAIHVRRENIVSRRDKSSSKGKSTRRVTQPDTCNYKHCMGPSTHKTEDCLFAKLAAKIKIDP